MTSTPGGSLGIKTRFASPPPRVRRFTLQSLARELLPGERVGICLRHFRKQPGSPSRSEVWYSPRLKKSHYGGLIVCGSVWMCPVCAAKISEKRRVELASAISKWPGSIFLATFTLQHTREDRLSGLRDDLRAAYRRLKSGKAWITFEKRFGLVGSVAGFECTVSTANGWHPHLHVLFFSKFKPDEIDIQQAEKTLQERFKAILEKKGRYVSAVYGVRVEKPVEAATEGDSALKKYVSKWGLEDELTKSPVKKARDEGGIPHYSPFQLLELYGQGIQWAGSLFQEYAAAMKGSKQLVWSKGLRAALGLVQEEKTDDELAQEVTEIGDQLMAALSWSQWKIVLANDARAELLNIADSGDVHQVNAFLSLLGIRGLPGGVFDTQESDREEVPV